MSCCPEHEEKNKDKQVVENKEPKSLIGKWLYRLGKNDVEKKGDKHEGCH